MFYLTGNLDRCQQNMQGALCWLVDTHHSSKHYSATTSSLLHYLFTLSAQSSGSASSKVMPQTSCNQPNLVPLNFKGRTNLDYFQGLEILSNSGA